jgi:hypothetical protein
MCLILCTVAIFFKKSWQDVFDTADICCQKMLAHFCLKKQDIPNQDLADQEGNEDIKLHDIEKIENTLTWIEPNMTKGSTSESQITVTNIPHYVWTMQSIQKRRPRKF